MFYSITQTEKQRMVSAAYKRSFVRHWPCVEPGSRAELPFPLVHSLHFLRLLPFLLFTGSIARSANLFSFTQRPILRFFARRGDTLHRWGYGSERLTEKDFCCPAQNHNAPGGGHEHLHHSLQLHTMLQS